MTGRRRSASVALLVTLGALGCAAANTARPDAGGAPPAGATTLSVPTNVWHGVYASTQAQRGALAYAEECSSCHAEDLRGSGNAPSLVGVSFLFLWENRSLEELFTTVRTEMPTNEPNSLPASTYAEIVAYILERNSFPAGERDLVPEPSVLEGIAITASAPLGAR